MAETTIKVSLDDDELLGDLKKIGRGFDSLSGDISRAGESTKKLTKDVSGAEKVFGRFLTLELAKKIGAFADRTLRAAEGMDGLSQSAKEGAKLYTEMADSAASVASSVVIWGAELAGSLGAFRGIRDLAMETAEAWKYIAGIQGGDVKGTQKNNAWAEAVAARQDLKVAQEELQKESTVNNEDFYLKYLESAKESEKIIDSLGKKLEWNAKQLQAFKRGASRSEIDKLGLQVVDAPKTTQAKEKKASKEVDLNYLRNQKDEDLTALIEFQDQQQQLEDQELERYRELVRQKLVAHEEYIKKLTELEEQADKDDEERIKQNLDMRMQANVAILQSAGTMFGGLSALAQASAGKNKEMVKISLALARLEAIANTAAGVTMAYRQGGVAGLLTGVGIAAKGAASVMLIEKQQQQLWDGGIVQGAQSGDTVDVRMNGGEMALTRNDQKELLSMIRGTSSGGAGMTVNFSPNYTADVSEFQKRRDYREMARTVQSLQADRNYGRVQRAFV